MHDNALWTAPKTSHPRFPCFCVRVFRTFRAFVRQTSQTPAIFRVRREKIRSASSTLSPRADRSAQCGERRVGPTSLISTGIKRNGTLSLPPKQDEAGFERSFFSENSFEGQCAYKRKQHCQATIRSHPYNLASRCTDAAEPSFSAHLFTSKAASDSGIRAV